MTYDIAIVGGGINGAGIAADAAGRGLTVLLAEKADLGSGTSSASSKLIHGGLRYLEHRELRLVREALAEREVLLAKAPHIVWPLRFLLPHVKGMRSRVLLRAGLLLYDHLARRAVIPGSGAVDLRREPVGAALRPGIGAGFSYWDCWVDDARLVVLNARAAAANGATILTRAEVVGVVAEDGVWRLEIETAAGRRVERARALVNAAGPWAGAFGQRIKGAPGMPVPRLRLVQGSHIVVARAWPGEAALLLQSPDGRVVFALPFEERFTLIGTTDTPFAGDASQAAISAEEERYLLAVVNGFLSRPLAPADIVWRYAGVRPLYDDATGDPSKVTRDYRLELSAAEGRPPLLTVLGGKITTYRKLAEAALERLAPHLGPHGPAWTRSAPLPGGELGPRGAAGLAADLARARPGLDRSYLARLVRRYGNLADALLGDARSEADLGEHFGGHLTAREVAYLASEEWALAPDDVLWRRTKAGLHLAPNERARAAEAIERLL
ncbi:MAG: glycerol-3-phosphate dehydrogenase [Pseudomonadota bacterium]